MLDRQGDKKHRIHRNVLYSLIVVMLVIQIITLIVMSGQITKLDSKIKQNEINFEEQNVLHQTEINQIADSLRKQEEDFSSQISFLKSEKNDFSGIIEKAVKGVVGINTDKAIGSGFIISDEGFIVTNYHVIEDAKAATVITQDSNKHQVRLIGFDNVRDVALLKIDSGDYEELALAESSKVQVGNKVIAIGNPLGLSFSVTEGIISAINREGPSGNNEYLQTDVSLNPGNSGGPLINTSGEVVGINNFKIGGTAEGLGFALESEVVKIVVNEIANGTIAI